MHRRNFLAGTAGMLSLAATGRATAQDPIILRYHTLVPMQASLPNEVVLPWGTRIEEASGGRIKIEYYGNMTLGGAPQSLYDQVKDHVVDFTQTVVGYTPGRFPRTETFELPFLITKAEPSSVAAERFVRENSIDEFVGTKLICAHTHGPGLIFVNRPVEKLEDLRGLKIRGGSRIVNDTLAAFGAEPITIPITAMAEALTTGVLDGTTISWDLSVSIRVGEIVHHHVEFAGNRGLYTQMFMFVMSQQAYDALPPDLQKLFDDESGVEIARQMGAVGDKWDAIGRQMAIDGGNTVVTLDEAETQRWIDASGTAIDKWYAESEALGIDGRALHQRAEELVAEETAKLG